ncbi:MAG: T9SS type A sorting domain-containing protein, partial [Bacteroidia bacterium]|nr:T9SS type A sorting domain-containing protein [Bacteroidia bacterium]
LNIVSPQEPIEAVVIYDVQGRKVAVNNYNSNRTIQVDVSSLEAAMYFVTIHTEIGILTKRVIKE